MGYYHPVPKKGNQADLAKQYGVAGVNHPRPGTTNRRGGFRSHNQVESEISAAMSNDYSTREFLKYDDEARDAMKNGLPSNRKQNTKLYDMMKQAHKDNGNGGKYSSAADRAGVAQGAFEDYEKEQRSYVDEQLDKMRAEMPADADTGAAESAAENMTFNEYLQNKDGGQSAEAGAQKMAGDAIKSIASNPGAMAKGKAKQGQYVLSNLGSDKYEGGN